MFLELKESFERNIKDENDRIKIKEAYLLADKMHKDQLRKSGEPYIIHPLSVAKILADYKVGPETLEAALLHDVVEDTSISLEEIEEKFGSGVAILVDGVTKISRIKFSPKAQAENVQKMLIAMSKDIRVVVIKLADRLHNMRTLMYLPADKRTRIAEETLDIYAPLSHKLGMNQIKTELEDTALQYSCFEKYEEIRILLEKDKIKRDILISTIKENIDSLLELHKVKDYDIKGRVKNIYSIYKKMTLNNRAFEDIYDLLAIRIIVSDVSQCYNVLGIIHSNFTPIPKRFKDYIAVPKPNMYQSLHTTVLSKDGSLFEVQIRTLDMDEVAEKGIAAHWAYKENKSYSKEREQFEIASKLKWYGELMKMTEDTDDKETGAIDFVDTIKGDILIANVYVFTPTSEVVELPKGSTPIDFAFRIHTDIGIKLVGAMVNNKIVTLDYILQTGDVVSCRINKNSLGPNASWLKIAKSQHARHKIKAYLNKLNKDTLIAAGKDLIEKEIDSKLLDNLNDDFVKANYEKNNLLEVVDLYLEVGKGNISAHSIKLKLNNSFNVTHAEQLQKQMDKVNRQLVSNSDTGVVIDGLTNPSIKISNCCLPIPNEEIVGFVSRGGGIIVHSKKCPNLAVFEKNRFILATWGINISRRYPTRIKVTCATSNNILTDVVTAINSHGESIAEIKAINHPNLETTIKIKISVDSDIRLESLFASIKKITSVYEVEREFK
ncbi:MAG: bifunctional (p)ppGpp synthetase/guanosine-3',5'-bis(diphosphate) 3'-pyrophosphohydrolase [Acholeplasmatales bacterium]|nr:bifunctional (p)ppGpp synthetase/guanosine-3',5'-bis(diphosphate) 3'-pyrophosphohydrolase [Acholeplasmatales bacterium]